MIIPRQESRHLAKILYGHLLNTRQKYTTCTNSSVVYCKKSMNPRKNIRKYFTITKLHVHISYYQKPAEDFLHSESRG